MRGASSSEVWERGCPGIILPPIPFVRMTVTRRVFKVTTYHIACYFIWSISHTTIVGRGIRLPLPIIEWTEASIFQVEEVPIPKIQSSPAKSILELYAGVEGEEMKRYM